MAVEHIATHGVAAGSFISTGKYVSIRFLAAPVAKVYFIPFNSAKRVIAGNRKRRSRWGKRFIAAGDG